MTNSVSSGSIVKHRSIIAALALPAGGLILILLSQPLHIVWFKVELDRLIDLALRMRIS
jgi:hypothetical protein